MHGASAGQMSLLSGDGNFWSSFASGAISSLVSSGIGSLGPQGAGYLNSGTTQALMIVGGGLSGGISSSIAGGDFGQGMLQGLITSGLNHVAHYMKEQVQVSRMDKRIRSLDKDPNEGAIEEYRAEDRNEATRLFAEKLLPEYYRRAGNPCIETSADLQSKDGHASQGQVNYQYFPDGGYSYDGIIKLRNTAFLTYRTLGFTLLHELSHAIDIASEFHSIWRKKYNYDAASNMSEVKAYQLQESWGSDIASNPNYLKHLNYMKNNNLEF